MTDFLGVCAIPILGVWWFSSELGLLCKGYFYTVSTKTDCEIAMNIEDQINKLFIMEESLRGRSFRKNLNITE